MADLKNDEDSFIIGVVDSIDETISSLTSILRKLLILCDQFNANKNTEPGLNEWWVR